MAQDEVGDRIARDEAPIRAEVRLGAPEQRSMDGGRLDLAVCRRQIEVLDSGLRRGLDDLA